MRWTMGQAFDPSRYVEVEYVRAHRMVSCRISDPGTGFSLDDIPHAAANPADDPIRHAEPLFLGKVPCQPILALLWQCLPT